MRILAYEFITGGGLAAQTLPPSMAREGDLMLSALTRDLAAIPGVDITVARDPRLASPPLRCTVVWPRAGEPPFAHYARAVARVDAVWPIAPETGGVLEELTQIALAGRRTLLGCRPDAVHVASSKLRTAQALAQAGLPAVPTYGDAATLPDQPGAWVVKPDDGAGCADTLCVATVEEARSWLRARRGENFIAQPWIEGAPMSLSLLCRDGEATLLSCNRQHVSVSGGRVALEAITVNVAPRDAAAMEALARGIARALPGLWGYVGVDLIDRPEGPLVIEINPRLTTSYCGLRDALGQNVAEMVLKLLAPPQAPVQIPRPPATPVEIVLESLRAG